jgi:hypothetical protein
LIILGHLMSFSLWRSGHAHDQCDFLETEGAGKNWQTFEVLGWHEHARPSFPAIQWTCVEGFVWHVQFCLRRLRTECRTYLILRGVCCQRWKVGFPHVLVSFGNWS